MDYKNQLKNRAFKINSLGHLEIAGIDTTYLVKKYGTPLVIYDIQTIKTNVENFKKALDSYEGNTVISYASKAFSSVALFQLLESLGLSIDVVSGGELFIAQQASFPGEKINFHGNNKLKEELKQALSYGVGHIIVDNFYELELLEEITAASEKKVDVLLRLTPGVTADTHKHIITGNTDSKFGFDLKSGQAKEAVLKIMDSSYINLKGLHMHIGSQIFETKSYTTAINQVLKNVKKWQEEFGFQMDILNIGGGFGVQHIIKEEIYSSKEQLQQISIELMELLKHYDLPIPELWIEPGRSIVGSAGTTLYELGSQKMVEGIRHFISVDGGMADNIRPALYDAKYFAALANRMTEQPTEKVSIAGKACESGDMLINDTLLPKVQPGDLLAIFNTGDYTFSMASNYNRLPRPAVIFVEDEQDFLAIRRETPTDFMRFEKELPDALLNKKTK